MQEKYDLHCHSTASDGALTPSELLQRAHEQGVTTLALTDHDTTNGLAEAQQTANSIGLRLIPGIEFSANWQGKCLHIIGLAIDPNYEPLHVATQQLQQTRLDRAQKIAEKLDKKRIPGAFEYVQKIAGTGMITRSHFADFLVAHNHVSSQQDAFDRYLGSGKPAHVSTIWADLSQAVDWINQSGGVAVLAHPLRYKLSASWMKRLLMAFKEAGGRGIEVVIGRNNPDEIRLIADYAKRFELAGSVGSDFHNPSNPWIELGRLNALPAHIQPVWELF